MPRIPRRWKSPAGAPPEEQHPAGRTPPGSEADTTELSPGDERTGAPAPGAAAQKAAAGATVEQPAPGAATGEGTASAPASGGTSAHEGAPNAQAGPAAGAVPAAAGPDAETTAGGTPGPNAKTIADGTPGPNAKTTADGTPTRDRGTAPANGTARGTTPDDAADGTSAPAADGTSAPAADGTTAVPTGETAGADAAATGEVVPDVTPRFRERTRMRRRLRYLRRLRELAFRDLGGLIFDLHRFGRERSDLVELKLAALAGIDRELRTLETALRDRREFTELREAGIAACPRCGTLHDTHANFCPGCGTTLRSAIVRDAPPVVVTPADEEPPSGHRREPGDPSTTSPS